MKIAVVGATGLVGSMMLKVLEEQNLAISKLIPVASAKSVGKNILFKEQNIAVVAMEKAIEMRPDIALFSAGGETSKKYAPEFAKVGTCVIDNSAAWRMQNDIKLIVPEVNGHILTTKDKIIANPNCSTIQMVLAINPLHQKYKIKRVVVSTYQAVSGSGIKAVKQMNSERKGEKASMVYPHPIDLNCIPHGGYFLDNAYTSEEVKLVEETQKIIGDPSIKVTATVVRIPIVTSHSESINLEFEKDFDLEEVKAILESSDGITVIDDPANNQYPMPLYATDSDQVFVGRIRRDESQANSMNMWVVSDNLRKGAATNAVQIAALISKLK
jgi:aspartate-semialdehyde dehydrogenase